MGVLSAAYNYQLISGASEGAMVSRIVDNVEQTYAAYRDASGSLAVARLVNGVLTPATIWTNMPPSNTSINISRTGVVLVSFWSGNKYRYATTITPGLGNCGPSSNWRCGDVALPSGMTATAKGSIHGDVDSTGRNHFVYAFRNTGPFPTFNGLYHTARIFSGVWAAPVRIYGPGGATFTNQQPSAFSATTFNTGAILHFSSYGGGTTHAGRAGTLTPASNNWIVDALPNTGAAFGSAEHAGFRTFHDGFCEVTQSAPAIVRVTERVAHLGNYQWFGTTTVYDASQPNPPSAHCSLSEREYGGTTIAFASAQGGIHISHSPASTLTCCWLTHTVDSSSTFSKPSVDHDIYGKILVLYHGPGYLKFAREQ